MSRSSALLLGALAALAAACNSQPMPRVARAGTTIGIAVGNDYVDGTKIGYGAQIYEDQRGIYDDQRGSLKIELSKGSETRLLRPRVITRVWPDPATDFALDPTQAAGGLGALGIGLGQVLAVVELPIDLGAGLWTVKLKRFDRNGASVAAPTYTHTQALEILAASPGQERFNPLTGLVGAISQNLETDTGVALLYPWPKVVIRINEAGGAQVAAAHFELAYPTGQIASIRNVFEEERVAQRSIIQWSDDPPNGLLTIDLVDPTAGIDELAVVFEPIPAAASVTTSQFVPSAAAFYDIDGDPITATLQKVEIR